MTEPITISFVGTTEIKTLLEQWATEDDRSISYIMRQILKREQQRRSSPQSNKQQKGNQANK